MQIVIYGIGGPEENYRVLRYRVIDQEFISIAIVKNFAEMMRDEYPSIQEIYAMDNRWGLRKDCTEAFKKNSMAGWIEFKDLIEREGLKII